MQTQKQQNHTTTKPPQSALFALFIFVILFTLGTVLPTSVIAESYRLSQHDLKPTAAGVKINSAQPRARPHHQHSSRESIDLTDDPMSYLFLNLGADSNSNNDNNNDNNSNISNNNNNNNNNNYPNYPPPQPQSSTLVATQPSTIVATNLPRSPPSSPTPIDGTNDPDVFWLTKIAAALAHHIYHPDNDLLPNVSVVSVATLLQQYDASPDAIVAYSDQIEEEEEQQARRQLQDSDLGGPHSQLYDYYDPVMQKHYWFYTVRGSHDRDDWIHNALQLIGKSKHYTDSARIAMELSRIALLRGIQLIFTGHSKGGCHAAVNSMVTSRWAITFNAPGASPQTKAALRTELGYQELFDDAHIYAYTTCFDIVSGGFDLLNRNKMLINAVIGIVVNRSSGTGENQEFVAMMNERNNNNNNGGDQFIFQPPDGQNQFTIVTPADETLLTSMVVKLGFNLLFSSNRDGVLSGVIGTIREQHEMGTTLSRLLSGFDFFLRNGEMEVVPRGETIPAQVYRAHARHQLVAFLVKRI